MATSNVVPKLYRGVIEDVIKSVRESFLNEGVDEQVLQELKQIWESKLLQSRAVDGMPPEGHQQQPTRQQYVYPLASIPQQPQQVRQSHQVNIAPAMVHVPDVITQKQNASGQTAIFYPSTHAHALGQMTAAASAATMAIGGTMPVSQVQQGTDARIPIIYPTTRTIQTTEPIGNLQQRIVNSAPPQPAVGTVQRQVLGSVQQQVGARGTTQVIRGSQPRTSAAAQAQVVQASQLQGGDNQSPIIQVIQVDGANDSDSEDDDEDEDDLDDEARKEKSQTEGLDEEGELEEDDPLNTDDDVSEDDPTDLFDTDNVVVCQFDKIARSRNKWKFHLKDGIMNLKGRDYVFQKATGEAEW